MTIHATYCSQCGAASQSGSQFCGGCGNSLRREPAVRPCSSRPVSNQGDSSKALFALLLGVLGFVLCGPFTSIPGALMAWNEMSVAKQAGRAPSGMTHVALWLNVTATAVGLLGCMMTLPMMMLMSA